MHERKTLTGPGSALMPWLGGLFRGLGPFLLQAAALPRVLLNVEYDVDKLGTTIEQQESNTCLQRSGKSDQPPPLTYGDELVEADNRTGDG